MILRTRNIIEQIRQGEIPKGYIRTVSGISPTDWKRYTFGDIYTERKEPGSEELPLLMVSIHSGVSDGEVDEEELPKKVKRIEDKSQYKKAVSGDLVFNMMRAWQGAIGTVRTTGMVSPAYIVAKPNDKVYPLFMDYYTRTPQMINQINRQSYGVTDFRKRLYWDSFATIGCTLPPIEEQRKIAAILTTQDRVIELKEKHLAEKQRQKKYLMQQLLTGKKRLPGFSEQWKKVKLGDVCVVNPPKEDDYPDVVAFLGMADISENGSIITEHKKNYESVKTGFTPFKRGDILIAKITPCFENGKGALTDKCSFAYGFGSTEFHVLRCKAANSKFIYYHTRTDFFRKRLEAEMVGSAGQKRVQANSIINYAILLPPPIEQTAIAEVLSAADREIELLQQDIEQEKEKKKALMQLLLTGIVRVKHDSF